MSLISPWTSNLDADGFDLVDLGEVEFRDESADPTADGRMRRSGDELTWRTQDVRTNTTTRNLAVWADTSGAPAASIGIGMLFQAESADENPADFGAVDFVATDVGAGTEDTDFVVMLRDAGGALAERFRATSDGEVTLRDAAAAATAVGNLSRNGNILTWHDRTGAVTIPTLIGGGIFGLTLSNNGVDATNDIDIAVGAAVDDTENRVIRLTSALVKQLDAAWAVGTNAGMLDTGTIANTTYHIYLIHRSDTGVTDILASTSASSPTMPTSYDYRRRIGSILRVSAAIVLFTQDGDYFIRTTAILDVNSTNPGTDAVTRTLSVPTGVNVWAMMNIGINPATTGAGLAFYVSDLATTDAAPSATAAPLFSVGTTANTTTNGAGAFLVRTNTSAQIRSRASVSGASDVFRIATLGWWDRRGRDA